MAVLAFHIDPGLLPGGFIGVDMFFVISGFLMGGIVYRQVQEGSFRWREFIARRLRRLAPALLSMLVVVLISSIILNGPDSAIRMSWLTLSALLGSSNILLWTTSGYFGPASETNPLLHTWSLAVEEQFYLGLPLLLIILSKRPKSIRTGIIMAAILLSLLLCQAVLQSKHPKTAFFLLPFRVWELGLGLLVAIALPTSVSTRTYRSLHNIVPLLGAALIGWSATQLSSSSVFPGLSALPSCIGTALLLATGHPKPTLVHRLLGNRTLAYVGAVSYSLYLWHAPCLATARLLTKSHLSTGVLMTTLVATATLTLVSYYYIETPFRNISRVTSRRFVLVNSIGCAIILFTSGTVSISKGLRFLYLSDQRRRFDEISPSESSNYVKSRFNKLLFRQAGFSSDGRPKTLVIGDSFAQDFVNILAEGGVLDSLDVRTVYIPAICQPVLPAARGDAKRGPKNATICRSCESLETAQAAIRESDYIFVAACWEVWSAELADETIENLQSLTKARVILVGTKAFPTLTERDILLKRLEPIPAAPAKRILDANRSLSLLSPRVEYIDLIAKIQEPDGRIRGVDAAGSLLSHDGTHLTRAGASHLARAIQIRERVAGIQSRRIKQ